jgi:metal-dependent hydrolase (beta-lactamase superfamily II)
MLLKNKLTDYVEIYYTDFGMCINIKVLQVLFGDAIVIKFKGNDGIYHNIFVDGGFSSTYVRTIGRETRKIVERGERIDLFIITHIDQDHIGGVLNYLRENGEKNLVDEYWFNWSDNRVVQMLPNNCKISYSQGITLREFLKKNGEINSGIIHDGLEPFNIFGAKITILSPDLEDIHYFKKKWTTAEHQIQQKKRIASAQDDYCASIENLSKKTFIEDTRIENRVGIAFLFEYNGKAILLLADSHPSTIERALKKRGFSKFNKLRVDMIKLSHHTSRFNTSPELLELLECNSFIISANGKNRHFLPHKETLSRILVNPGRNRNQEVSFIFNYDNPVIRSIFEESDFSSYNFNCFYPKGNENGYLIKL